MLAEGYTGVQLRLQAEKKMMTEVSAGAEPISAITYRPPTIPKLQDDRPV